jgi:hypothetical protein
VGIGLSVTFLVDIAPVAGITSVRHVTVASIGFGQNVSRVYRLGTAPPLHIYPERSDRTSNASA